MALRIATKSGTNELDRPLFAHTSPIYIERDGERIFRPRVAWRLISEILEAISIVESRGTFAGDAEKESVLEIYREGIAYLRGRMKPSEE